jgi:phenol hydroxylase P0 protein
MTQVNANNRWVRVTRDAGNGFIEFDFMVADQELSVELILPARAFAEFCSMNKVRFLDSEGVEAGTSGLLKRIK